VLTGTGDARITTPAVYRPGGSARIVQTSDAGRTTGTATAWDPGPDGAVEALAIAPDGGSIFVGGAFKWIGAPAKGQPHAAELKLHDGGSATGWRPVP